MSSKNGRPELISLLQYLKDTRLDNPNIIVKDKRIIELDEIVTEVKQDEEWEDARMSIYGQGLEQGEMNKTKIFIRNLLKRGMSNEDICELADCTQELMDEVRAEQRNNDK